MHYFLGLAEHHQIGIDAQTVSLEEINAAMDRLAKGQVKDRLVIGFAPA